MKISDIFIVKTGSRIIEEDAYIHCGNFPCITAQTANEGIAWYVDENWLEQNYHDYIIRDKECLTWTKDGAKCGTLFYRNFPFFCTDVCGILILKHNYQEELNLKWFLVYFQGIIDNCITSQSTQGKLYNTAMSDIEITYPFPPIEEQNAFVVQYEKLEKLKKSVCDKIDTIDEICKYGILADGKTCRVGELFTTQRGNVISEEDIYRNFDIDGIPIYSSQTSNQGCMGRVNKAFYDISDKKGEAGTLTWTTDGYAGRVFYRDHEYLYTNVCGKLKLKKDIDPKSINLKYIAYCLNQITHIYRNAEGNNAKLMSNQMENIEIVIPSIEEQNAFVEQYEKLEKMKRNLVRINQQIDRLM